MVDEEILLPDACRCCLLEDKDMVYVFDVLDEFETQISDLIARNGAITIMENDPYSKHICGNCLNDLAIAERFVLRCRNTNDILLNITKTQSQAEPNDEKVSYVIMTEPLYEEPNPAEATVAGYDDIVPDATILTAEPNAKELNTLYCIDEEEEEVYEEELVEENVAGQLGIIITADMGLGEGDTIIDEKTVKIEDVTMYRNLLQHTQPTASAIQSDECSTVLTDYEERLSGDGGKNGPIESDDEFDGKATASREMYDFKHNCSHCGASFVTPQNYARHLRKHDIFACQECLAIFESEKEVKSHEHQCQPNASALNANPQKPAVTVTVVHNVTRATCTANASVARKKAFECSYCNKRWVSRSALAAHLRTHTGERPFRCSYCPKRFTTMAGLDLHERRHTGTKPYTCGVCGKGFAESSNMKVHMLQHTRQKPHVCTVCNRAFGRVFLLQLHQRTHTGEKPYECEVCKKAFSQQGDLAAHRRIHSGERPFVCTVCGKGFIKSTALTQHRKSHEKHLLMGELASD